MPRAGLAPPWYSGARVDSKRSGRLEGKAREEVSSVLDALRDGIGAEALGLFDDDRGDRPEPDAHGAPTLAASAGANHPNFWEAFDGLPCAEVDWRHWYHQLRTAGRVESTCSCGSAHRLGGYLIHGRWALLLVTSRSWEPGAVAAISSAIKLLSDKLPPAHKRDPLAQQLKARAEAEDAGLASAGTVWFVRKVK